jgi:hypothetical protein
MKKSKFTIRSFKYWCPVCDGYTSADVDDEELCAIHKSPLTMILGDEVNPHPKQLIQTDQFGNVINAYDNPKWMEWERENTKNIQ